MPQGFLYSPGFISEIEEKVLASALSGLQLEPFAFHGHLGNRRVVSFGLRYDYGRKIVTGAEEPPKFFEDLRIKVAKFVGRLPEEFEQIGVNEYPPGAGIGWHRDKKEFGDVVGLSLLSSAKMRLRKRSKEIWMRASQLLEPRSIYLMSGEARTAWEHSIPPVSSLRYSIIFRTVAPAKFGSSSPAKR
jgi:alkylated DNA repair dioxygenase AlkB